MTYEPITRSGIKVLAKDDNVHCLGKRDQYREDKNKIGATWYHGIDVKEGMPVSKYSSLENKIKSQEKMAK